MGEIETTLESASAPRPSVRRAVVRRRLEQSENIGAMPMLLTVDDAADLLRTTRRAIYAMLERRQLPGVIRIGRRVYGGPFSSVFQGEAAHRREAGGSLVPARPRIR